MFAIATAPGTKLPFTTVIVQQITFPHRHRDRAGFAWTEKITQDIHVPAFRLDAVRPAVNDNQKAA